MWQVQFWVSIPRKTLTIENVHQDIHHNTVYAGKQKQTTKCPTIGGELTIVHSLDGLLCKHLKMFTVTSLGKLLK